MVAKLKLRIVDGIPEVDGDPTEIAEVIRQLSITSTSNQFVPQREEREISKIQDVKEIDPDEIIRIVESSGEPFTLSMGDLQKRIYGKRISSKEEKDSYEMFRRAFDKAKKQLEKKYPDYHWKSLMVDVDGMPTKRFTLVRNPSIPVQQQIEKQVEQPETQPLDEEVESFKM